MTDQDNELRKHFNTRAYNILKDLGCETLEDVASFTTSEIRNHYYIGKHTYRHIKDVLAKNGMALKITVPVRRGRPKGSKNKNVQSMAQALKIYAKLAPQEPQETRRLRDALLYVMDVANTFGNKPGLAPATLQIITAFIDDILNNKK